jgi:hypothetical protein
MAVTAASVHESQLEEENKKLYSRISLLEQKIKAKD